jgi:hypothetical protein
MGCPETEHNVKAISTLATRIDRESDFTTLKSVRQRWHSKEALRPTGIEEGSTAIPHTGHRIAMNSSMLDYYNGF